MTDSHQTQGGPGSYSEFREANGLEDNPASVATYSIMVDEDRPRLAQEQELTLEELHCGGTGKVAIIGALTSSELAATS
jgi:hypothetical protein